MTAEDRVRKDDESEETKEPKNDQIKSPQKKNPVNKPNNFCPLY